MSKLVYNANNDTYECPDCGESGKYSKMMQNKHECPEGCENCPEDHLEYIEPTGDIPQFQPYFVCALTGTEVCDTVFVKKSEDSTDVLLVQSLYKHCIEAPLDCPLQGGQE